MLVSGTLHYTPDKDFEFYWLTKKNRKGLVVNSFFKKEKNYDNENDANKYPLDKIGYDYRDLAAGKYKIYRD